jgi:hypothetical protein
LRANASPRETLDPSTLDAKCRDVLVAVERLTTAKGMRTCPCFYARTPWVHETRFARQWREHGSLRDRVGWPSIGLVAAIDLLDTADSAARFDDIERQKREAEANRERMERQRNGGEA